MILVLTFLFLSIFSVTCQYHTGTDFRDNLGYLERKESVTVCYKEGLGGGGGRGKEFRLFHAIAIPRLISVAHKLYGGQ